MRLSQSSSRRVQSQFNRLLPVGGKQRSGRLSWCFTRAFSVTRYIRPLSTIDRAQWSTLTFSPRTICYDSGGEPSSQYGVPLRSGTSCSIRFTLRFTRNAPPIQRPMYISNVIDTVLVFDKMQTEYSGRRCHYQTNQHAVESYLTRVQPGPVDL